MTKEEILGIRLNSLGIPLLTRGIARHNQLTTGEQLNTVGDVVKKYPYRLRTRMKQRYDQEDLGAGKDTINEFKRKLLDLGLTPDDWPALVPHKELLDRLSKNAIMDLPIREVLIHDGVNFYQLQLLMGEIRFDKNFAKKVRDLLPIDLTTVNENMFRLFVTPCRRRLMVFRKKLVAKGFNKSDGPFFKWDPEPAAIKKAEKILRTEGIKGRNLTKFSQIAVNRGWVS